MRSVVDSAKQDFSSLWRNQIITVCTKMTPFNQLNCVFVSFRKTFLWSPSNNLLVAVFQSIEGFRYGIRIRRFFR